jgi:hypothetical protein
VQAIAAPKDFDCTEIFGSDSLETRYQLHRQGDGCSVRLRIGAALRRLGRLPSVSRTLRSDNTKIPRDRSWPDSIR